MLKDAENPGPAAHRSLFLDTLDDAAIDAIIEHSATEASPSTMTQIRILGGAMAAVPAGATAFAHRDAGVMVVIITPYEDVAEGPTHQAFTQAFYETLTPRATGVYANFLEEEGEARVHEAYPDADLPPPGPGQARLRPDEPLPPEPEHPPSPRGLTASPSAPAFSGAGALHRRRRRLRIRPATS